ncbi:uncharacterized protein PpBr36_10385 [Pyricularia pennisetigena]|uniref:uncharacterized protein n=1 Tax=Pyricularia pennisetigena TaxID=1578925 RepID=UPI00114D8B61|nr:uncharacterized protein PpBr36_10385 [Pyricularia pennisetigena]TLS21350.1 hypothetical protein PpBr36_10385 [Pyricularia pennisetigena]
MADDMYNKLAHDLLHKDAGELLTRQDGMTLDLSRGIAKCLALCMQMMKSKLKGSDIKTMRQESEKFGIPDQASKEVESAVDGFWKDAEQEVTFRLDKINAKIERTKAAPNLYVDDVCLHNGLKYHYLDNACTEYMTKRIVTEVLPHQCTFTLLYNSKTFEY